MKVSIDQLVLDPNNYRFVDIDVYTPVDITTASDPTVQARIQRILLGKNMENVLDLITSFKANGYLKLEPIHTRRLQNKKYLVLEGNRRIATLKYLHEQLLVGADIGKLTASTFEKIEISVSSTTKDLRSHYIAMGLHHISGKKKWNPLNQAKLICDMLYEYHFTEKQITDALACSLLVIRKSQRSLALINEYKVSDFGDNFKSDMFSFFEETVKNPILRDWLEWDDATMHSQNKLNQALLFSWLSPEEESVDEKTEQVQRLEPILSKSADIRILAKIIKDDKAIDRMIASRSITEAYAISGASKKERALSAFHSLEKDFNEVISSYDSLTNQERNRIKKISENFVNISTLNSFSRRTDIPVFFKNINSHFSTLRLNEFRRFHNLEIRDLNKINLFVGSNNSGKTSLLEAIYLLTQLNYTDSYVEVEAMRGKVDNSFSKDWLIHNLSDCNLEGVFNSHACHSHTIVSESDNQMLDRLGYMKSLTNDSDIEGEVLKFHSEVHLYDNKDNVINYNKTMTLCNSALTTPYRRNRGKLIDVHRRVVEMGKMSELMSFIQKHFDSHIVSIDLVMQGSDSRFIVKSTDHEEGLDLTKYGEGLQRIFEISLYLINCENGCLLVDEIDSGVHISLLSDFINFVNSLATKYNVQLFITTHSKECVDKFSDCIDFNSLSAYRLEPIDNNGIKIKSSTGEDLYRLIKNFNIDIR